MGVIGSFVTATLAAASIFTPIDIQEIYGSGSINYDQPAYIIVDNMGIETSSTARYSYFDTKQLARLYESQYLDKDIEFGMPVDLSLLKLIRNLENYESNFIGFTQQLTFKGKLILAYELSQLSYNSIFGCEEEYILQLMRSGNLEMQEVALNAITNWDNINLIRRISDLKLKNIFLQQELDELIEEIR